MRSSFVPSASIAWATAEPAPPAPTSATRSSDAPGKPRLRPAAKPDASVLWPVVRPSRNTTVLTAFIARASSERASSSGITACLHGNVTLTPANPASRAASSRRGSAVSPSASTSRSSTRYWMRSPWASPSASCSEGDNDCWMPAPMRPSRTRRFDATVIRAPGSSRCPGPRRCTSWRARSGRLRRCELVARGRAPAARPTCRADGRARSRRRSG